MADHSNIAWTDSTFNTHWGCQEVSDGCDNCYAKTLSERFGRHVWGPPNETERMVTSNSYWRRPLRWNDRAAAGDTNWTEDWQAPVRGGERRLVFTNSMSDIFEQHPQLDVVRQRLWTLIERTPMLDWLLLTKRPQNMRRMLPQDWIDRPRHNVWLGTSAEHQQAADLRIPALLRVPAVVHFISAEPLLGPLDLRRYLSPTWFAANCPIPIACDAHGRDVCPVCDGDAPRVDWVITGGESGARHRQFDIEWVRDIDQQCSRFRTAHFFKQHGGRTHAEGGCLVDGVEVKNFPTPLLRVAA